MSEVCEFLPKVHYILDKAVSKWVGNLACILAYLFNSISRQHCEVWASQFLFFTVLGMWFLLVRLACMAVLTGLWHRHAISLLWAYLSLFLLRGVARPDHGLGSISQYRRDLYQGLCQGLVEHLWLRSLPWSVGMRLIEEARSLLVAVLPPVLLRLGEKGAVGVSTPYVLESSASSASPSSTSAVFQVGMLFKFFDQSRSITSNRFVLIMVQGHHLQLRSLPPIVL